MGSSNKCVGPRGYYEEGVPSNCPTTPRFGLRLGEVEIWACERHLPQAVKAFGVDTPVAVTRAA